MRSTSSGDDQGDDEDNVQSETSFDKVTFTSFQKVLSVSNRNELCDELHVKPKQQRSPQQSPITLTSIDIPITPIDFENTPQNIADALQLPSLSNAGSVIEAIQHKTLNAITDIKEKVAVFVLSGVMLTVFFFVLLDEPKYKFMGAEMFCMFFLFHTGCVLHILKAQYLHRIKIVTTCIQPDFGIIVFPLQIKPFPSIPIKSMSEMFAIRGSQLNHMFGFMCFGIGGVVMTAIYSNFSNLYHFGDIDSFWDKEYIELFLNIATVLALPLMGMFDLNPNDTMHQVMHYLGVICMMISVFPYALQSNFNVYSVLFICGSFGNWIIWLIASILYPNDLKDEFGETEEERLKMRKCVHSISRKCILFENVGCAFASMSNVAYVWNLKDVPTY